MTAMKNLPPGVYGLAMSAWRAWMKRHIHVENPTDEDLNSIPGDIGATAACGKLPPGYHWEGGVPVLSQVRPQ